MKSRLIAGIISLLLVLLVVVGPVYLSEKLEVIETSRSGLIPFEEVVSENSSSTVYEPYVQFSEENIIPYNANDRPINSGWCFFRLGNKEGVQQFDVDGTIDLFYYDGEGVVDLSTGEAPFLYMFIELSAQNCLTDNAILFSFMLNTEDNYRISTVLWRKYNDLYNSLDQTWITYPNGQNWGTTVNGKNYYNVTFDENDLTNGASCQSGGYYKVLSVIVEFPNGYTNCNLIYSDLLISPQYYEEEITIYENETITTYVPFIQSITPYSVHKVSMVAGGISILLVGAIASPLPIGNAFNNIFPVSAFTPKRTKRRGKQ